MLDEYLRRQDGVITLAQARRAGLGLKPLSHVCDPVIGAGAHAASTSLTTDHLVQLLRKEGITGWRTNYPVGGYKVGVAFEKQKVAIEVDGWAFHSNHDDFQHDRARQNNISPDGGLQRVDEGAAVDNARRTPLDAGRSRVNSSSRLASAG